MDMKRRKVEKAEEGIRKGPEKDPKKAKRARRYEKPGDKDLSTC
jgi:hypothetical protein